MAARTHRARLFRCFVVLALTLLGSTVSDVAHAQPDSTVTRRITVFTGGGFGGREKLNLSGYIMGSPSGDLSPTPIAGIRYEAAFLHYLAFGGQLRTSFWKTTGASRRNPMIDFSITPRVRIPFVIDARYLIEPYIVVPVGFTLGIWNRNVDLRGTGFDRANPGLNLGALLGVTFLTRSHVGAVVEFGWMHHVVYDQNNAGERLTIKLNQATLHAGVTYAY